MEPTTTEIEAFCYQKFAEIHKQLLFRYPSISIVDEIVPPSYLQSPELRFRCEEHSMTIDVNMRLFLHVFENDHHLADVSYGLDIQQVNQALLYVLLYDHGYQVFDNDILRHLFSNAYFEDSGALVIDNCLANDFAQRDIRVLKYRRYIRRYFGRYYFASNTQCSSFLYFIHKVLSRFIHKERTVRLTITDILSITKYDGQTIIGNSMFVMYFLPSFYKCVRNAYTSHRAVFESGYLERLCTELASRGIVVTTRMLDGFYATNLNPYFSRVSDIDLLKEIKKGASIYRNILHTYTMNMLMISPADTFLYSVSHSRLVLYMSFLGIDFYSYSGARSWAHSLYGAEVNAGSSLPLFLDSLRQNNYYVTNLRISDIVINIMKEKQAMIKKHRPITKIQESADSTDMSDVTKPITELEENRLNLIHLRDTQKAISSIFQGFRQQNDTELLLSENALTNYSTMNTKDEESDEDSINNNDEDEEEFLMMNAKNKVVEVNEKIATSNTNIKVSDMKQSTNNGKSPIMHRSKEESERLFTNIFKDIEKFSKQ